jgi:hypothetical protein
MTADYSMRSSILDAQIPLMNFFGESISGYHCQQINIIGVGYRGLDPCFDSCLFL